MAKLVMTTNWSQTTLIETNCRLIEKEGHTKYRKLANMALAQGKHQLGKRYHEHHEVVQNQRWIWYDDGYLS